MTMASQSDPSLYFPSGIERNSEEQSARTRQTPLPNGLLDDTNTQTKELPLKVWEKVVGNLEEIGDFARVQRVSQAFYALVKDTGWTRVTKIEIEVFLPELEAVCVWVWVDMAAPSKPHRLCISEAAELLEKLVQKATKTTALRLDFNFKPSIAIRSYYYSLAKKSFFDSFTDPGLDLETPMADVFFQHFLDSLTSMSKIKIKEFTMQRLSYFHSTDTIQALARFLNSKNQLLTSLKVHSCFETETAPTPIPAELLQAFRDCQDLEHVKIMASERLTESILHEKTKLQTLDLDNARAAVTLLESGVSLRQFRLEQSGESFLLAYDRLVKQRNRTQDHPLRSLPILKICNLDCYRSFPWALFPCLEQLLSGRTEFSIEGFMSVVRSFLVQWASSDVEKTMEWRIKTLWFYGKENLQPEHLAEVASGVEAAIGCHVTLTQGTDPHHTLVFNKGNATLKILIK